MSALGDTMRDDPGRSFIDVLQRIAGEAGPEGATMAEIVDRLDERAFAILIFVLAIPCLVPGLPGAQIIAIPIFLLAGQLLLGFREPWLPGWFLRARIKKSWLDGVAAFAAKRLRWTERLSRPRWRPLASGLGERAIALVMALAAITIMLPLTNTIPSIALTAMSVGLMQRDGVFTGVGALLGAAWAGLVAAIGIGLVLGAGFALRLVSEHLPWLADRLGLASP